MYDRPGKWFRQGINSVEALELLPDNPNAERQPSWVATGTRADIKHKCRRLG